MEPEETAARKETLSTRIAEGLRAEILLGALPPGQKMNLEGLRDRFGTSATPLREAMSRLVAERLITAEGLRGYRVAGVSADNLAEITALRVVLEPMALRLAIARGDLDWEGAVAGAVYKLTRTPRDASDPSSLAAWETAHRDFHQTLIRVSGMPLLIGFCAELHALNDRYRRIYLARSGGDPRTEDEHREIAEAAMARRADAACAALRGHIERAGTNLARALAEQEATL